MKHLTSITFLLLSMGIAEKVLIRISAKDAHRHINEQVIITDSMYSYRTPKDEVLVDLGAKHPDQLVTVVLKGEARSPEDFFAHHMVNVVATIVQHEGQLEVVVTDPELVTVNMTSISGSSKKQGRLP